jgi:xanthine/uracil permease
MFNPTRYQALKDALHNFKAGIPLTASGLTFGAIVGLILNLVITLPFKWWVKRKNA